MRSVFSSWVGKLTGCALCLIVLAASADARLISFRGTLPDVLPGIDGNGNADFGNTSDASVKVTVNTREERILIQARGKVQNLSRRSFRAEDSFVGLQAFGLVVVSDLYQVSSRGSASFTGRVYAL
ncbi:hypothetical protein [Rubinisphaera sp. JC750]|uniref:hypothetical protein n=1 Tax=Rubinisphaera sp. JC750 TaxID=2898658 RepID=UPI001F18A8E6|nr:hypothetical protein [Rubinisphaera sp. JC750]